MEDSEKKIEETTVQRKERIKNWLKDPNNLILIGALIFAFALRLYFFILTKNQPLWWDEAEYMSTAKSFAGINHFDFKWALNRFPGFPMLVSLFYMLGINNEVFLRFILAFVPSILAIILIYFVLRSMYPDKRIAVISVLIFSVLWEHVFFSNRFHTENFSLIFEFLTIIVLFNVYFRKKDWGFIKSKYALLWIILFAGLCIFFRSGNMFFIPILILFLIITGFCYIPKKARFYSGIGLFALAIAVFILMVFLSHRYSFVKQFYDYSNPLALENFSVFYLFYQSSISIPSILFYAFLIGAIVTIGRIVIFPEGLKKVYGDFEDNAYKADIFNLILILGFLFFFVVMLRSPGVSTRWFFVIIPGLFAFTAKGLIYVGDLFQSLVKVKYAGAVLLIILVCLGVYTQFNHADTLVKYKLDSYSQVRDSGLWIKENSNKGDVIVSASLTQHRYYSERNIIDFYVNNSNENESAFNDKLKEYKPRYLVISAFEPGFTPDWAYNWPAKHNDTVKPVKAYYDTPNQPVLVIYEIKH